MEKTFGNLEFAGEDKTEQRRINGRMAVLSRSFNLYSDVQRADDIVVILPAEAGEKHFDFAPYPCGNHFGEISGTALKLGEKAGKRLVL